MSRWPQIEILGSAKLPLLWEFCFCCCLPLLPELAAAFLQSKPGIGNLTEPCIQYLRNTAFNLSSFFPISILVITDQCSFLPAQNIELSVDHIQKNLIDKIRTNFRHGQLFDKYWTHYYFPNQCWVVDKYWTNIGQMLNICPIFVHNLSNHKTLTKIGHGQIFDKYWTRIGQMSNICPISVHNLSGHPFYTSTYISAEK